MIDRFRLNQMCLATSLAMSAGFSTRSTSVPCLLMMNVVGNEPML